MRRLFGVKQEAKPTPTLEDTGDVMDKRVSQVEGKVKKIDDELNTIREQMKRTKPGPAQNRLKQRGMQLLKQKKFYEQQRDQTENQRFNLDQLKFTTESMQDTIAQVDAMKATAKELKKTQKTLDIGKIENLQDELSDLYEDNQEIQEILGRSYAMPEEIDDDELEAELAGLEDDMLVSNDCSYLDDALAPTDPLPVAAKEEETDPKRLEEQLGL